MNEGKSRVFASSTSPYLIKEMIKHRCKRKTSHFTFTKHCQHTETETLCIEPMIKLDLPGAKAKINKSKF